MPKPAPHPESAAVPEPASRADQATDVDRPARREIPLEDPVTRAERRVLILQRLTEIGMRLAHSLDHRVAAEDEAAANAPEGKAPARLAGAAAADDFSRLSRAIRLTVTLEAKADQQLRDLEAGLHRQYAKESDEALEQTRKSEKAAFDWRRSTIELAVLEAAESDPAELSDAECEKLAAQLDEWLDGRESWWADKGRPVEDVVDRLCRWFRLSPDWALWDGEGWIEPERPKDPWPWDERAQARDLACAQSEAPTTRARPLGRAPHGLNGAAPPDLE